MEENTCRSPAGGAAPALVVFTDLDGTLLDAADYSYAPALPALELLEARGVPLVVCTSKTRAEVELWRERIGNRHPFISENGGAVFVPEGYFPSMPEGAARRDGYWAVELGAPYGLLREALARLRDMGFRVRGFGDMTAEEVSELTGLPLAEAGLARMREYDEPFTFLGDEADKARLLSRISAMGLRHTEGRLCHIMGGSDKGRAAGMLKDMYARVLGRVRTAALGDSPNDLPMLLEADFAFAVARPDGTHHPGLDRPGIIKMPGAGPAGWNEAVRGLLDPARMSFPK